MHFKTLPNFIVHYSRGKPFQSITGYPPEEWQTIIEKLDSSNSWGLNRFADPDYLRQRMQAETKLRKASID